MTLYRELTAEQLEWDGPLSVDKETQWRKWTHSLSDLEHLQMYVCMYKCYCPALRRGSYASF